MIFYKIFKEIGVENWKDYVGRDERYYRAIDVFYLGGDSSKDQDKLGWKIQTSFEEMISKMVKSDIKNIMKRVCIIND